jgi:hypothetical protein
MSTGSTAAGRTPVDPPNAERLYSMAKLAACGAVASLAWSAARYAPIVDPNSITEGTL